MLDEEDRIAVMLDYAIDELIDVAMSAYDPAQVIWCAIVQYCGYKACDHGARTNDQLMLQAVRETVQQFLRWS